MTAESYSNLKMKFSLKTGISRRAEEKKKAPRFLK